MDIQILVRQNNYLIDPHLLDTYLLIVRNILINIFIKWQNIIHCILNIFIELKKKQLL